MGKWSRSSVGNSNLLENEDSEEQVFPPISGESGERVNWLFMVYIGLIQPACCFGLGCVR